MAASENSANEHDRLKEAISDIKDDAKETRDVVRGLGKTMGDLKDVIMGWKGDVEVRLASLLLRLEALEKARAGQEKTVMERVNVALNVILTAGVAWVLYKVTGIKAP